MERNPRRWHGLILCWFGMLSLLLTWPLVLHPNSQILGSPDSDTMKHIWTLWWMRESVLGQGLFPFHTTLINHPTGWSLYPIEPLNGLFAVLLGPLPLVLTSNVLALINLTLTGYFAALLGRRLSTAPTAALVSGTLLQTGAFTLFTFHVGVGELQHIWWLPLGIIAWLNVHQKSRLKDTIALSAVLVGATLSCFYLGFFLATAVSVLSAHRLVVDPKRIRLLAQYGVAASLGLMVLLPITSTFADSYGEGEPPRIGLARYVLEAGHGQPVTDPASARLDLPELFRPASDLRDTASREQLAYGGGRYLGWPLIVIVGLAAWKLGRRSIPWLGVGGLGVLLATGSYLVWGGVEYSSASVARLGMPFLFMNRALGYLVEPINFPNRFLVLTLLSGAVLGGLLTQCQLRGRSLATPVLLLSLLNAVDVQLNQLTPPPMARFSMTDYAALSAAEEDGGAILDLNLTWRADPETRGAAQVGQLVHKQAIQGVPIERVEQHANDGQVFAKNLPMVTLLEPAFKFQKTVQLEIEQHQEDLALLRDAGFDRVLLLGIGADNAVAPALVSALQPLLGEPIIQDRRAVLFEIPQPKVSEQQLGDWKQAHARRIEAWWGRQEGSVGRPLR